MRQKISVEYQGMKPAFGQVVRRRLAAWTPDRRVFCCVFLLIWGSAWGCILVLLSGVTDLEIYSRLHGLQR